MLKGENKLQELPLVDIIIPHYNGVEILHKCLGTLEKTTYPNYRVTIVDNGTTDESIRLATNNYKWASVVSPGENLGYAGGCNFGFRKTDGKYVVFLNNDTEQESDWLLKLVEFAEMNDQAGALQPKILSIQARNRGERIFDYAGAAGGLIDNLGYPYSRGRIFDTLEPDQGQYDNISEIFWASGTAMFMRRSVGESIGLFDEDFFAHMEEIDLCWRMLLAGYKIYAVPQSVVYHHGGATLPMGNPRKVYLNHRNNIVMLIKNRSLGRLMLTLPIRIMLELLSMLYYQKKQGKELAITVFRALGWNMTHVRNTWGKRRQVQALRKRSDREIFENLENYVILKKMMGVER
ncbi:MAG: glycosyltransferase family 2 protein [Chlorobiales bacterium]|jgi:GT2 family glycosyltransferase|nr:glycosyltransferase family 2 protein [Chlorobiales bacterium]